MVPRGSVNKVAHSFGPMACSATSLSAADINGGPEHGVSSGQAKCAEVKIISTRHCPRHC